MNFEPRNKSWTCTAVGFALGSALWIASFSVLPARAQATAGAPPPKNWTAEQDQQNMLDQLGIEALRPGPSGDESAPNHANYDESKANPYPKLPNALRLNDGQPVTTAAMWWKQRRPQLVEMFSRDVYGFVPKNVPGVTWSVTDTETTRSGFVPVIAKRLVGHVDNSSYPAIEVNISAVEVLPAHAKGPVPVLIMLGRPEMPASIPPSSEDVEVLNRALRKMLEADPAAKAILDKYPRYELAPDPAAEERATMMQHFLHPSREQELLNAGWGYVTLDPGSVQADNGAGLTRGIVGLVNKGQPRHPDDWGALRAWSWGAARTLDYLETDPQVDSKHVGIEGVSRYGKAALVTLAFEPRFAMGLIGSSGKGGATLFRRNFGEAVSSLATGEYYWMAGNFERYGASKAKGGAKTAEDLPVDQNELIALCAPRLTFISYGVPSAGDAKWLDQRGSFMATVAAQPVFQLLGAKGLGVPDDPMNAVMPPVNHGLLDGQLAWRQDDGGHTDAPNMPSFIKWADGWIGHTR